MRQTYGEDSDRDGSQYEPIRRPVSQQRRCPSNISASPGQNVPSHDSFFCCLPLLAVGMGRINKNVSGFCLMDADYEGKKNCR